MIGTTDVLTPNPSTHPSRYSPETRTAVMVAAVAAGLVLLVVALAAPVVGLLLCPVGAVVLARTATRVRRSSGETAAVIELAVWAAAAGTVVSALLVLIRIL